MSEKIPVVLSWSGGKDSCMALRALRASDNYEVAALLTTMNGDHDRISMHGVRSELVVAQAQALGVPLRRFTIPAGASNALYDAAMGEALAAERARGIATIAFGDLFLADIRAYREAMMARNDMVPIFPVWGRDTRTFVLDFIASGHKAIIVCADLNAIDGSFAGRVIDDALLADLPAGVDPCGENGEFHTFVFDGPGFSRPIDIVIGESVTRDTFRFCDLTLAQSLSGELS